MLAALAVAAAACSTGSSGALPGRTAGADPASPGPTGEGVSRGAGESEVQGPLAIASAVEAAHLTPRGRWVLTAGASLLDGHVHQDFQSTRSFDRDRDRASLEMRYQVADAAEPPDVVVRDALSGLVTEMVRDGDRVLVRLGGEGSIDVSWYDIGDVPVGELAAWHLLAVDPQSDRVPLLSLFDDGGVEVDAGIEGSSGRVAYPIRVPVPTVVSTLTQDAPSLAALLPEQLAPEVVGDAVPGTVVLGGGGGLASIELDLGALFMAVGATSADPGDAELFASADVTMHADLQLEQRVDIVVPAQSMVVPPAAILDEVASDGLVAGDCLPPGTDLGATILYLVSCDEAHTLEVFQVIDGWGPSDAYPGRTVIRSWADQVCMEAFGEFVGRPFDESIHSLATVTPLAPGWEAGDRQVTCLAESFLPRRGTLAAAAQ